MTLSEEQARGWLAAIVDSTDDAIVTKDRQATITTWNAGAERLYGYRAEEAIGRPLAIIIPPWRAREEQRILQAVLAGDRVDHYETERLAKDGTVVDVSLTVSPIAGAGGEILGASAIARDIRGRTARERALHAANELVLALGGETDLGAVLDAVAAHARRLLQARAAMVMLAEEGAPMTVCAASGAGAPAAGAGDDGSVAALVASLSPGHALLTQRLGERAGGLAPAGAHAAIAPLVFRARTAGALVVLGDPAGRPFDRGHAGMLGLFGVSAAAAIGTAQSVAAQLQRRAMEASEEERRRWARELHDDTLQALAAMRMIAARAAARGDAESAGQALAFVRDRLEVELGHLRHLIAELRSAELDELGLEAGLAELADQVERAAGVAVETRVRLGGAGPPAAARLDPRLESSIYRIVQEALTNVSKHAGASRVELRVEERAGEVHVEVRDDGRGLAPGGNGAGFGLRGMRERVEILGGAFELASSPGGGVTVRATLPLLRREPSA